MKHVLAVMGFVLSSSAFGQGGNMKTDVILWYEAFNRKDPALLERVLSEKWVDIPPAPSAPGG